MGIYTEYIDKGYSFQSLQDERKAQLKIIETLRGRPVLVFASDLKKDKSPILIFEGDKIPFKDQLTNIKENEIDIIIETPGGYAEVVDDLISYIRKKFEKVGIIIPGTAKSAGTIFAMGGDEILMTDMSCLGPIDAQVSINGNNRLSADTFIDGLDNIKREVDEKGKLNPAYIPMLQTINPGIIEYCKNAQNLSKTLVTKWLSTYKFKFWTHHSTTGNKVTQQDKESQANHIAKQLCKHSNWLSHGKSIRIEELRKLGLKVERIEDNDKLYDAVNRYNILLHLTFDSSPIYKIYETTVSQIYNSNQIINQQIAQPTATPQQMPNLRKSPTIFIDIKCEKCKTTEKIQIDFVPNQKQNLNCTRYPKNNIHICKTCKNQLDLRPLRMQLEASSKRQIIC